jgi:hypothetical protein
MGDCLGSDYLYNIYSFYGLMKRGNIPISAAEGENKLPKIRFRQKINIVLRRLPCETHDDVLKRRSARPAPKQAHGEMENDFLRIILF